MTRDDFEYECDYLRDEMRAERRKRLARERDYAETGYLGDDESEDGDDECR